MQKKYHASIQHSAYFAQFHRLLRAQNVPDKQHSLYPKHTIAKFSQSVRYTYCHNDSSRNAKFALLVSTN